MADQDELLALRAENARLIASLESCGIEWRAGVCEKPRIKGGDCRNRLLIPLSDTVIYDHHLAGERTVGVYPLPEDDSCYFLAVDFDEAEWRDDARAFMQSPDVRAHLRNQFMRNHIPTK